MIKDGAAKSLIAFFSSHTKIKLSQLHIFHDDRMRKTPKAKTTFESRVFKRLEVLGACQTGSRLRSAQFDSTQQGHHMT